VSVRLFAVGLVSAGVLAYEVLLARLFSIVQWYHFAYMVRWPETPGFCGFSSFAT
jgi:hypothetical protein